MKCLHRFENYFVILLSYDVASGSEITPCNKIDKPLNDKIIKFKRQKWNFKVILMSYDKKKLTFVHLYHWIYWTCCQKEIKCSASLAFYLFSPTHLVNSIKHEHSCKILYEYRFLPWKLICLEKCWRITLRPRRVLEFYSFLFLPARLNLEKSLKIIFALQVLENLHEVLKNIGINSFFYASICKIKLTLLM